MKLTNEELIKKINELVLKWKGKKPEHKDVLNPLWREWRVDRSRYLAYKDWLNRSLKNSGENKKFDPVAFWKK